VDPVIEDSMAVGLAGMSSTGSPRQPMDRTALRDMVNASADYTSGAQMHPRFYAPASDPAFFPVARPNPVQNENGGARYGLRVSMPVPVSVEAGATQANGRLIRGKGTSGSFAGGASA
jgi:hypothetical protein